MVPCPRGSVPGDRRGGGRGDLRGVGRVHERGRSRFPRTRPQRLTSAGGNRTTSGARLHRCVRGGTPGGYRPGDLRVLLAAGRGRGRIRQGRAFALPGGRRPSSASGAGPAPCRALRPARRRAHARQEPAPWRRRARAWPYQRLPRLQRQRRVRLDVGGDGSRRPRHRRLAVAAAGGSGRRSAGAGEERCCGRAACRVVAGAVPPCWYRSPGSSRPSACATSDAALIGRRPGGAGHSPSRQRTRSRGPPARTLSSPSSSAAGELGTAGTRSTLRSRASPRTGNGRSSSPHPGRSGDRDGAIRTFSRGGPGPQPSFYFPYSPGYGAADLHRGAAGLSKGPALPRASRRNPVIALVRLSAPMNESPRYSSIRDYLRGVLRTNALVIRPDHAGGPAPPRCSYRSGRSRSKRGRLGDRVPGRGPAAQPARQLREPEDAARARARRSVRRRSTEPGSGSAYGRPSAASSRSRPAPLGDHDLAGCRNPARRHHLNSRSEVRRGAGEQLRRGRGGRLHERADPEAVRRGARADPQAPLRGLGDAPQDQIRARAALTGTADPAPLPDRERPPGGGRGDGPAGPGPRSPPRRLATPCWGPSWG